MSNMTRKNEYLIILSMVFISTTIAMNYFSVKPLSFGTPIIIMDAGTLISWIPFVVSDVLADCYGKKIAEKISIYTAFISLIIFIIGFLITFIPTLDVYNEQRIHFSYIFNNGPRVIIASFVAFIIGILININIIDKLKRKIKKDSDANLFFRIIISSVFGQFADNLIFQFLAFAPIGLTWYEMRFIDIATSAISTTIIELLIESIITIFFTKKFIYKINSLKS